MNSIGCLSSGEAMPIPSTTLSPKRSTSIFPQAWCRWQWARMAERIVNESGRLQAMSIEELQRLARQSRSRVRLAPFDERTVVDVCALVREIAGREHGIRHFPVQVQGALAMLNGWIAEMRTGEGKTLTSLMTVTLLSLRGQGCHVFTANDYLAARDCEFAKPVLRWFGLTANVLVADQMEEDRKTSYQADVTYGSEKEFGFDFLRDRMYHVTTFGIEQSLSDHNPASTIQNGHAHAVIDEADSILLDQAGTPLIISCPQPLTKDDLTLFHWSQQFADTLSVTADYVLDPRLQSARLTQRGVRRLRLNPKPMAIAQRPGELLFSQIEYALAARHFFHENREYLVIDGRVEIIDQGTGRILPGRKWRDGLQQAIEIRAGLKPSDSTGTAARVTLQSYLKNYRFLCGMTGTASEARSELTRTYGLRVMPIQTHRRNQLLQLPARIFVDAEHKWTAITLELTKLVESGRAALVGTTSIASSELCADRLRKLGIDVRVLHARHHQDEAEIVRQAGEPGRITVATNMAGRGTDIKLHPAVRDAGGLHVVLTEMNRSTRIDRQLAGRAARQGDPGSSQALVSLDDELLSILGAARVQRWKQLARRFVNGELPGSRIKYFEQAQRLFERRAELERQQLQYRERHRSDAMNPLGLDPFVEFASDG
jgi:preprotein translocase subunit SecA